MGVSALGYKECCIVEGDIFWAISNRIRVIETFSHSGREHCSLIFLYSSAFFFPFSAGTTDTECIIPPQHCCISNMQFTSSSLGNKHKDNVIITGIDMEVRNTAHGSNPKAEENTKSKKGMVLPFQPLSLVFQDVNYYINMPHVNFNSLLL